MRTHRLTNLQSVKRSLIIAERENRRLRDKSLELKKRIDLLEGDVYATIDRRQLPPPNMYETFETPVVIKLKGYNGKPLVSSLVRVGVSGKNITGIMLEPNG